MRGGSIRAGDIHPSKICVFVRGENSIKIREMLGKVRACPSSFESFDTPSKIIKDDSLSIYETTLMKLKRGSQRRLIPPPDSTDCVSRSLPTDTNSEDESMLIDTDCSSANVADSSTDHLNSQRRSKSTSILHLFSKFKSHQRTPTITDQTMTMIEINGSSIEFQSSSSEKDEEIHELDASMGA